MFGTAAVIVTIESGVKVLSGDDAIFYGNQLQSSIDYLECTDSNGNIYYVDHNGKMYDENYIPINTVTDSTSISITGAKINTATFVEKLQAIIDKFKGLKNEDDVINYNKELALKIGTPIDYSVNLDPALINYPETEYDEYETDLATFSLPAGHIYNVYINTVDKELCDKNNYLHYVILDTTQLTGDINYKMNYYLLYNNFWDYLQCNISFLNGLNEDIRPSYTCRSKTLDSSVTYRYKMVIDSDDFPNGYNLGKIKGDSIDNDSICVDTKKTNLPDIDVYNSSPIAQNGDIDINPDIINSIVNEGKSIDDVLGALNYEGEGESILDQLTVGDKSTENNKNDIDVSNDTDKTTGTNDEGINNSKDQTTEQRIKILEDKAPHIFRKASGHLEEDTPENRKIFEDVVNDEQCYLGKCQWGTDWYQKTLDNGKQIWVEVYKNTIRDAGINDEPKCYNSKTGLKELTKPSVNNIKTQKSNIEIQNIGGTDMVLSSEQVYNAIIEYLTQYNKQVGNEDEIEKTIERIKTQRGQLDTQNYPELEGYNKFFSILVTIFHENNYGEVGVLLSEMEILSDGSTSDPAAWDDWMKAINKVTKNNVDTDSTSNSGDASSIPLTTGIVGAIGSIISRKRKK